MIVAAKAGRCTAAACGGRIRKGEMCWYETAKGTRHVEAACRDAAAGIRPNRRAAPCARCGRRVPAGEGNLKVREVRRRKTYTVTCAPVCAG
ncbi:hypothetical protein GCM10012319_31640 [Comamonas sp. KCTC 72670]|nr:hypothetical protein GCM10012319_31640 [Comamonas sp. KCTC 72670]